MARKKTPGESEKLFIHAPIEAVFRSFVEPLALGNWLDAELDLVPELNGKYCVTASDGTVLAGTITIIAWPEALTVVWDGGQLELRLQADFGGTAAELTCEGDSVMDGALTKLEAYLQRSGRR